MAMTYPDAKSKTSLRDGEGFQDYVARKFSDLFGIHIVYYKTMAEQYRIGESVQGIEVKLDNRCSETGRLSIEIAEKSKADNVEFVPSGIYRVDNTWLYVQGNRDILFVFAKTMLKLLHKTGRYQEKTEPTIKAFYLPIDDAKKYCAKMVGSDSEAA